MFKGLKIRRTKAQIFTEYAGIIAFIVAIVVAMSLMVKRVVQGRIKDTKDFMMTTVDNTYRSTIGSSNLLPASIPNEYEPYYAETRSVVARDANDAVQLNRGGAEGIFTYIYNEATTAQTNSIQLPPGQGY